MSVTLNELPDNARVWIYGADRSLSPEEGEQIAAELRAFVDRWTAHGAELRAGAELVEDRFAVVAVDEASAPASGCSIDAMVHRIAELERELDCSLLDGTRVFYRSDEGSIEGCDRATFRTRAEAGAIRDETAVFDLTLATLGDVRAGELERPVSRSWHRRLLPDAPAAP